MIGKLTRVIFIMRVLFIYTDYSATHARRFNLGLSLLSAALKRAGHETYLYHYHSIFQDLRALDKLICNISPDVLAYSAITNQIQDIRNIASKMERHGIYSVLGGVHPTLLPEECLSIPGINAVCRGEGECAFVEFLGSLEKGEDVTGILNFWVKQNGVIYRNACRPLIEDLDSLPDPDYDLFPYHDLPEYTVNRSLVIAASRGCVHDCTYCCNHALRVLYPNSSKYLRYKSPAAVITSIQRGLARYPAIKHIRFMDDTLSQKASWFREFSRLYKNEIRLPYSTNDRCTSITEEIADLYADSMCFSIDLGIESGNEFIRNSVMQRKMSNAQIVRGFELLKSRGINVNAFNVLGMPGETMESLLETVRLNARVKPSIVYNAFFQPFPGTEARRVCQQQGITFDDNFPPGFAIRPVVRLKTVSDDELIFVMKTFKFMMWLAAWDSSGGYLMAIRGWFERMFSSLLVRGRIPVRMLNKLIPSEAEFRMRHPRISIPRATG